MKLLINNGKLDAVFFTMRKQLLRELQRAGCDITLSGYSDTSGIDMQQYGVSYHRLNGNTTKINPLSDLALILDYKKYIQQNGFDLVHSYTAKANIYGSIGAHLAGVRCIFPTVNGLGTVFTGNSLKKRLGRCLISVLYRWAFSYATKVFFQNADDVAELVHRNVLPKAKCVVISGSGIDLSDFAYSELDAKQPLTFLLATRLLAAKGVMHYCEAARMVKKQYPQAVFALAGGFDGNRKEITPELLQPYIADGTIQYLGLVKDMPSALRCCSVFVLPSFYREGIPHVNLEAMGIGRALITTDSPGCRETVKQPDSAGRGENGFLVAPQNSGMLAEKMIWMIEHPDRTKQMGIKSRLYAEERFDVNLVNLEIRNVMGLSDI